MLNKLKQAGQMAKMAKDMRKMQKELEKEEVIVEEDGIKVVVDGTQKIKKLVVNGIENDQVVDILNKAVRKAQESSAKKMQEMAGGMSGLMNMLGQ